MKKSLLIAGALLVAITGQAQLSNLPSGMVEGLPTRSFKPAPQQNEATVLVRDTLHYFYNKNLYRNPAGTNNLFYYWEMPSPTASLNGVTHLGSTFMNSSTITVHGLEAMVMRNPASTSPSVPIKIYLHYLDGSNMPLPPIDSVVTSVSNSTGAGFVGGPLLSPKTVTNNFAVTFKSQPTLSTDTAYLFMTAGYHPTATATGTNVSKYGEDFGRLRYLGNWQTTGNVFGAGTSREFIAAPWVSFNVTAGIGVLTPTVCNNSLGSFSNTSQPTTLLENRQFNFNKFAAVWAPATSTNPVFPTTDSIYNWTFTGAAPPASNAKHPTVLFNTAGTQNINLSVSYWPSVIAGYGAPAYYDATAASIGVDASQSPTINVSGNTNICAGQSTTLSATGNPSFTWYTPSGPLAQPSIVVVPSTTTQYTVEASNGSCISIKIITVQVSAAPNVVITGPSNACVGVPVTLVASGAQSFLWSNTNPTGTITITSTTPGSVEYTVTGSSGSCPQSVAIKQITINALPVVSLTTPSTVCSKSTGGTSVTLVGTPSGAGGVYNGTGVVGNVFTPNNPGSVPVTFVYTDPATGCSANAAKTITVMACQVNPGISEQEMSKISVFPNPAAAGIVYVQNLDGFTSLTVVNILGEQIRTESVSGNAHRLDLSTLPEGQYFIRLSNQAGVVNTVKIVNQH